MIPRRWIVMIPRRWIVIVLLVLLLTVTGIVGIVDATEITVRLENGSYDGYLSHTTDSTNWSDMVTGNGEVIVTNDTRQVNAGYTTINTATQYSELHRWFMNFNLSNTSIASENGTINSV
ncbi:MAG: hypothetical protein PHX61_02740, partial [Alphaproteobacteria bacterium]|nr:hypothetical protein [Alphaproteobacteria bacterium]